MWDNVGNYASHMDRTFLDSFGGDYRPFEIHLAGSSSRDLVRTHKRPFLGLSDLHLGNQKVTLKLVHCLWTPLFQENIAVRVATRTPDRIDGIDSDRRDRRYRKQTGKVIYFMEGRIQMVATNKEMIHSDLCMIIVMISYYDVLCQLLFYEYLWIIC